MTADLACPRCGGPMVERTNRQTGEAFLGCRRFPDCRGTRRLVNMSPVSSGSRAAHGRNPRPRRYRLSAGGRLRTLPDYVEILVARALGRNLTPIQGCFVQMTAVVVFLGFFWWLYASGTILQIIDPIVRLYLSQTPFAPSPEPPR
jgi:ssDNA-binding Zn-finger/Zn-ribbon topoisomerase 1